MENTSGNYVTGSGATAAVYTPTNAGAGYTSLVDMFQTDASYYLPYYDAYPNPPLTNDGARADIVNGYYGANGFNYPDNAYWRIYNNRLSLGHGIFEVTRWTGAYADSASVTNPWFNRGGYANATTYAGAELIGSVSGSASSLVGARSLVLVFRSEKKGGEEKRKS